MTEDDGLIAAYVLDGRGGGRELDWQGISSWKESDGVLWVHLDRTGSHTRAWLDAQRSIDPLCVEALLAEDTRPRSTLVRDGLLVNLRGVNLNPGADPEDMVALRAWIERNLVVTVRRRRVMAVQDISDELAAGHGPRVAADVLTMLASHLVARLGPIVADIDDAIDELEDQVLTQEHSQLRTQLGSLRRQAIALRRYLAPQRDVLLRLQGETAGFLENSHKFRFREIGDQLTRCVEDLDAARERAAVVQEELQNLLAERMNRTMYVLSLVTVVFLPLGLLTGLLGINVGGIPGTENDRAFTVVTVALVLLALVQLWFFRRRRLL
jgi:zinc transporter